MGKRKDRTASAQIFIQLCGYLIVAILGLKQEQPVRVKHFLQDFAVIDCWHQHDNIVDPHGRCLVAVVIVVA